MTFIPVGAEWVIDVVNPVGDEQSKYLLVGWLDNGSHLPVPVVAVPGGGVAELQHIIGRDPWTLRYATEAEW